jgi:hypothetical protein
MKMTKWTCIAALAFVLPVASGEVCAGAGDGAEAFVRGLYAQYTPHGHPVAFGYPDAKAIVDAPMLEWLHRDQVKSKGDVGALDSDPVCQCQDWEHLKVDSVQSISRGPGTATVEVSVEDGSGKDRWHQTVRFDLVQAGGAWKIHDIHAHDLPSLIALFRDAKY